MESNEEINDREIQEALIYTEKIINMIRDPLIILHEDLKVALANRSFYQTFTVKPEQTEGKYIYDLGDRQWDIPKLRQLLEDVLPKTTSFDNFEIEHEFPHLGKRIMQLNACRIYLEHNRTRLIVITIKDMTEHQKINELNEKIKELEGRLIKNAKPL